MSESFSERYGYNKIPPDHYVYEDAPEQLREYVKRVVYRDLGKGPRFLRSIICSTLLVREDPSNWSEYPNIDWEVDGHLHDMEWYQVYDVINADEAFTATSPYCLMPVTRVNGLPIGSGKPGPIFGRLIDAWSEEVGLDIRRQVLEAEKREEVST